MKKIRLIVLSIAAMAGAVIASAQQATISSVNGSATVSLPGGAASKPAVPGEVLPEGSTVVTGAGSKIVVKSHDGIETGLDSLTTAVIGTHSVNSEGVRTAVIDLKNGTSVSVLDPSKRAINNYSVRTPKGVAAARGTTYTTTVKLASGGQVFVTVNTYTGSVSFAINGQAPVTVSEGKSANSNLGVSTSIASAISSATTAEEKTAITESIQATVAVVSIIAQVSRETADRGANATLRSVVSNVTNAANELAKTDSTAAKAIVSNTVDTVQTFAGQSAPGAIFSVNARADQSLREAVREAIRTQPEVKVDPDVQTTPTEPGTKPTITEIIVPSTPSTPDITIIVSPSSP